MSSPTGSAEPSAPRHPGSSVWPLLWCLLAAALFGASTPATKPLTSDLGPFQIAGLLYAGAGLAVSPWAVKGWIPGARKQQLYLLGSLIFGGVIGPVLLVMGLSRAPAGSVALWLNLETVATAVLARTLFHEHLGGRSWLAVALIIGASLLLSSGGGAGVAAATFVAFACLAWGLDNNLTSLIGSYRPAQVTFAKGLLGAGVNLALGAWISDTALPLRAALAVMLIGALGYGLSLVLYVTSAQQLGATRSQLIFSTAPAWGLSLSWLWLDEAILGVQVLGAVLMLVALWLLDRERHGHVHEHAAMTHGHWHRHDDGHHEHQHPGAAPVLGWHAHEHSHSAGSHSHPHLPDLHHRHTHRSTRH